MFGAYYDFESAINGTITGNISTCSDRAIESGDIEGSGSFQDQKTLGEIDWDFNRTIRRKLFFDLASTEFVRQHRDVPGATAILDRFLSAR